MQFKRFLWLHRTTISLLAALMIAAMFAATVSAQTALKGQLVTRPLTTDDIALYKLPATTERSGGLSTVGLGQAVFLEADVDSTVPASQIAGVTWALSKKPASSKAVLTDSPLGSNVPIYEPSDRLIYQVAGRQLLRMDVAGVYTVTATVTTVSAGTVNLSLTLTAASYMGINACSLCHSAGPGSTVWSMVGMWSKTLHASIFTNGMNGVASDHYSASCLGCHTVGYDADPNAVNGGFDDVAKQIGWTFPTVLNANTFASLPDALKNVGNIQCENCHGPGSTHISSGGDPRLISVSTGSGVCGQCHAAATHHIKTGEWNNSMHAVVTRDATGAGRESCVGCHTGAGFVDRLQGNTAAPDTTYTTINCQTCHEPHGETTPGTNAHLLRTLAPVTLKDGTTVTNAGMGTLCINCHQSRQNAAVYAATTPGSARFGPHHGPQADMLEGVNGFNYDKNIPSSAHADVVADTCVGCHMQTVDAADPALTKLGGHTFRPSFNDGTNPRIDLVAACQKCHGPDVASFDFLLMDYNGDGVIEGVQTEVQHLLDQLAQQLPPVGQAKSDLTIDSSWTQPQLKAAYNYQFVKNDGSFGIHNTAYAIGLLKASIADLAANARK